MNASTIIVTIVVAVIGSGSLWAAAPKIVEAWVNRRDPGAISDRSVARMDKTLESMERSLRAAERRAETAEEEVTELRTEISQLRAEHRTELAQMRADHSRELDELRGEIGMLRSQINNGSPPAAS